MPKNPRISFIGFGEAAQAFVSGWDADLPPTITAFDTKTDSPATRERKLHDYARFGVRGELTAQDALRDAQAVFSVVTADQALQAAEAAAPHLTRDALWFDCNSCAPATKQRASEVIAGAGAQYVDVAVMAPVHPKKHRVPLLVSGPNAERASKALLGLEMMPQIAGPSIGQASTIKMLRSIMIKGVEALTAECLLSARKAGVEADVIASLCASDPDFEWEARSAYNLERMMVHGVRRAAEMREVGVTVGDLGLPGPLTAAIVDWQDRLGQLGLEGGENDLTDRLDRLLRSM